MSAGSGGSSWNAEGPLVSIVMLAYQRPQYIDGAVASVIAQDYAYWELVIVQDGDNPEVARAIARWAVREPRIRAFHRSEKGNIANATNYALRQSHGPLIAILDDDDAWSRPGKLTLQVKYLREHPQVVCVGGGAVVVDREGSPQFGYLKAREDRTCRRQALLANPIIHSSAMYRRSAADQVGGYDETLSDYQDWDFMLKLMRVGQVANLDEHLVSYRMWEGGSSSVNGRSNARSAVRITWRHRKAFPRAQLALIVAVGYVAASHLPARPRRWLYAAAARVKKRLTHRPTPGESP